jgi:chromosome partitioning protein
MLDTTHTPSPAEPETPFERFAYLSGEIQAKILELEARPNSTKSLRRFPTSEAAKLLRLSDKHLRTITNQRDDLPTGEVVGGNNRRAFTLEEIDAIRRSLTANTADGQYLPHRDRSLGEKLQVITLANFKGGAAKTTTAAHLAQYFALHGYRVLAIDLDSQASLTSLFGLQPDRDISENNTLYTYMRGDTDSLASLIRPTYWHGLDLLPANLQLYNAEFEIPVRLRTEKAWRFWRMLEQGLETVESSYDVVVCDCPPSLGYLSINGIYAATALIVPVPPAMMDFASTGQFFRMMNDTISQLADAEGRGKSFDFVRILISKFNPNDLNHKTVAKWMAANYGDALLDNRMAITTALDLAGTRKETYYETEPADVGRRTYDRGRELLDAVNREIEELVLSVWGRSLVGRAD